MCRLHILQCFLLSKCLRSFISLLDKGNGGCSREVSSSPVTSEEVREDKQGRVLYPPVAPWLREAEPAQLANQSLASLVL